MIPCLLSSKSLRHAGERFIIHYHCTYKSMSSIDDPCRLDNEDFPDIVRYSNTL